jgi:hypothetical protein
MREIVEADQPFVRSEVSAEDALALFADQPYKCEIIERATAAQADAYDQGEVAASGRKAIIFSQWVEPLETLARAEKTGYDAAILDYNYTERWPQMSLISKLWAAGTGQVGPSPVMAPAVLSQCAICLALATFRHPALAMKRGGSSHSIDAEFTPESRQWITADSSASQT